MTRTPSRLVRLLQRACSGEQAAALAYAGHARSLSDPEERRQLLKIEEEEWEHRRCIEGMLRMLGAAPDPMRERRTQLVGNVLGSLCGVTGWFLPLYVAGRLELGNMSEYEIAAREAIASDHPEFIEPLLEMAAAEAEHERYFRLKAESHWLGSFFPKRRSPPHPTLATALPAPNHRSNTTGAWTGS